MLGVKRMPRARLLTSNKQRDAVTYDPRPVVYSTKHGTCGGKPVFSASLAPALARAGHTRSSPQARFA